MPQVQISGLGAICANGENPETIYQSCLRGRSSVQSTGLAEISADVIEKLRASTPEKLKSSRSTILGFHTLTQAFNDSGWSDTDLQNAGFIFATTTGKIDLWEKIITQRDSSNLSKEEYLKGLVNQPLGATQAQLSEHFQIKGPKVQISSSCSASLQALAMGMMWIQSGQVERCIVGTTEIHNDLTRVGFNSLRLLSKSVCTPFDKNRTGINLGDGAAFLFLEKAQQTKWGYISGAGLTSDAFHPTSPHPEGKGSYLSMKKALETAKLQPSDIDWVYAHGTGSPANDLAESAAISSLFPNKPFVTSTKSLHGHTLGSCGGIEAVIGLLAMKYETIIPNANLHEIDPQISVNLPLTVVKKDFKHFVKNSLGFGGINVSVIFSKAKA